MTGVELPRTRVDEIIDTSTAELAELGLLTSWTQDTMVDSRFATGTVTLETDGKQHAFPAVATARISTADLTLLPHDTSTLLLTGQVSPAHARALKDRGWGGYVDAAGNASLRSGGLLIEVSGRKPAGSPHATSASAPFTRAGLPVTFALLVAHEHDRAVVQRDLVTMSGASIGTVNRVVRALRDRTPAMLDARNVLLRPDALTDEWISAYTSLQPRIWQEERFSSGVWNTPADVLEAELPDGVVLGSELAARELGAPIRPATALLHLPETDRRDVIRRGRLRRAEDGMVRLRPAFWVDLSPRPLRLAPTPLLRADLLLEDDPRVDAVHAQLFDRAP